MLDKIINSQYFVLFVNDFEDIEKYSTSADILAVKLSTDFKKSTSIIKEVSKTDNPLMICGCGDDEIDSEIIPIAIKNLDKECIVSFATEKNYKNIVPFVIEGEHYLVLKTPIDINLAKELNILAMNMGLNPEKIIMNTDIGALGYGYEYGYSIIEKIIIERKNDNYINMPIISEAPLESLKTKEAKIIQLAECAGDLEKRRLMIEICSASAILAAGANIIVMNSLEALKTVKGLI